MNVRRIIVGVSALLGLGLVLCGRPCLAGTAAEPGRATLDKLLKAVEANDYDGFVAEGTDAFKAGITKPMLEGVSSQLAPRMKKGYEYVRLGELTQRGCRVLLWKLAYKDAGDD